MKKHMKASFGISALFMLSIVWGISDGVAQRVAGVLKPGSPAAVQYQPLRAAVSVSSNAMAADGIVTDGNSVTQSISLHAGWNAIYLEVEPINPSPLVNVGTAAQPIWVHEQPMLEAVFSRLACEDCVESVWAWNVPFSTKDYIVDPAEGLWDEPGWLRYFPEGSAGPDGGTRTFLTDLVTMHTNTGYLVKMVDDLAAPITLQVKGQSAVKNQQWVKDSYNLAGFPVFPGSNPTVAVFFGTSPVTEARYLTPEGYWEKLEQTDTLTYGHSYLVYYDGNVTSTKGFTAPLNLPVPITSQMAFAPGAGGRQQIIPVENTSGIPITVSISFSDVTDVPLYYEDASTEPPTYIDLRTNTVEIPLAPGELRNIVLMFIPDAPQAQPDELPSAQRDALPPTARDTLQTTGERKAVLVIASLDGGTRWIIPMVFASTDMRGLWVGDVRIDDVSQARLGATNAEGGTLTIALRPRNDSGLYGAAEFQEIIDGSNSLLAIRTTLDLARSSQVVTPTIAMTGTAPYVAGYVFEDVNQNGQRDATEPGLAGIDVSLSAGGSPVATVQTQADGAYIFETLAAGTYTIVLDPATPLGYTPDFEITLPATDVDTPAAAAQPNVWPTQFSVDAKGLTWLQQTDAEAHLTTVTDLPHYNAEDLRVEPLLNFGYLPAFAASLWTGTCTDRIEERRDLGEMINGTLAVTITSASLNPSPTPVDDHILSDASDYALYIATQGGDGLACGEIEVGAPTSFEDGRGSEFTFRIVLRIDDEAQERVSLLPGYTAEDGTRITSAAFSNVEPVLSSGSFDNGLNFALTLAADDPLNPFKHKYHPDHDNLDAQFNPINTDSVPPNLWEVYQIRRDIELEFTDLPPLDNLTITDTQSLAESVGWGSEMWGGYYREVIRGLHQNDITVSGIFIIRHILPLEQMAPQDYDD